MNIILKDKTKFLTLQNNIAKSIPHYNKKITISDVTKIN